MIVHAVETAETRLFVKGNTLGTTRSCRPLINGGTVADRSPTYKFLTFIERLAVQAPDLSAGQAFSSCSGSHSSNESEEKD
jgi:hypothetical protein